MTAAAVLSQILESARAFTLRIAASVPNDALGVQYDPMFSPIGWHIGHIAWQEEVFALRRAGGQAPIDEALDGIFDSFTSVKAERGPQLPTGAEIFAYAETVRQKTLALLTRGDFSSSHERSRAFDVFRFLANHERQHAEIIGVVRLLGELYFEPSIGVAEVSAAARGSSVRAENVSRHPAFVRVSAGEFMLGSDDDPDGWDNERASHRVEVPDFELGRHPVSCGEWLEFMRAGGYDEPKLWSQAGNRWRVGSKARAPLNWCPDVLGCWQTRTLAGLEPVVLERPVSHVCWHEALAFARFAGARLPTEAEWEYAASWHAASRRKRRWPWGDTCEGAFANLSLRHPHEGFRGEFSEGQAPSGAEDLVGGVWEWTDDVFAAYPGFVPQAYAGYSAPWFDGRHRVVRGGSFLTQPQIARCTFRSWYVPEMRQVPLGVRLAKS